MWKWVRRQLGIKTLYRYRYGLPAKPASFKAYLRKWARDVVRGRK